jgi:hypothetical protein
VLTKVLFFIAAFWALLVSLLNSAVSFFGALNYGNHFLFFGWFVLVFCFSLLVGIVLMFIKKHFIAFIISSVSVLMIASSMFSLFPSSIDWYIFFFSVNMISFLLVIITSFILILFIKSEDREIKKTIEKTLEKLSLQKGKDEFLSLDTYNDLIENHLAACKEKEELKNEKSY